ncbi:MAG: hypothetical protein AAF514_19150, partial [Verrucomicrobiota bacterium]
PGGAVEKGLLLQNGGESENLMLRRAQIGEGASVFSIETVPGSLAPGEEGMLMIKCDPASAEGEVTALLEVETNDPTDPIQIVELRATITLLPTIEVAISAGSDDAEESLADGDVKLDSSDLELTRDLAEQLVGLRFQGVGIPPGARIDHAEIVFAADGKRDEPTSLRIKAQYDPSPNTFNENEKNLSRRPTTVTFVDWLSVPAWAGNATGPQTTTPDLKRLVQELVWQENWAEGNPMVFLIEGNPGGSREAESFEGGGEEGAAVLRIAFDASVAQDPNLLVANPVFSFGSFGSDGGSADELLGIRNTGHDRTLNITDVRMLNGADLFSIQSFPSTLAPGAPGAISIRGSFAGAQGFVQGILEIVSDDPANPRVAVNLSATIGGDIVDSDGDGVGDGAEAVAGTDPQNPLDVLAISSIQRSETEVVVSWPAVSGIEYSVEYSENLEINSWQQLVEGVTSDTGVGQYADRQSAHVKRSEGYYRVVARR